MKRLFVGLLVGIITLASPAGAYAGTYAALGDSVASGAGLPHAANATAQDIACGRSPQAYPYQVAAARGLSLLHIACSGAKADELYTSQEVNGTSLAPQIDAAFANGTPDLITITIGANDLRWSQVLRDCYTWHCGSAWDDLRLKALRADLRWELWRALYIIQVRSAGTPPKVVLSGYFKPFSASALGCNDAKNITPQEVAWLNSQAGQLDGAITSVVQWYSFASSAPVDFGGHELCTPDPWVQSRSDDAGFHPTAEGQAAIARALAGY